MRQNDKPHKRMFAIANVRDPVLHVAASVT